LRARSGPRLYLALLAILSIVACFLPLADHLGYELSEFIALAAGIGGAAPGIAAARIESESPARALARAVWFSLWALAIPVVVILLNGLRRPACDPASGFVLYLALAVPSGLLAACLGVACASRSRRGAPWIYAAIFVVSLGSASWPVLRGPQVFVFHHLGGMYPGPIYDEAIAASRALWLFRLDTLLYAAACAGIALLPRRRGALIALVFGAAAVWMSLRAERLHWKASNAGVDSELGGRVETAHLVLHFPREKSEAERSLLARDAETDVAAVATFFGIPPPARKIDVFFYRSADEKRLLIGAAETSFTKPWLRQIHVNDAGAPHPVLRHELVHALGADIAHGPWGVPGGLIPNMALVEGVAVAGDWPVGEFTVHEEARALRELKLLPDVGRLFKPGLFYAESGARAYTAAGSFIRWLWETRGPREMYELYNAYKSLDAEALAPAWLAFLDSIPEPPRAVALAEQRYSAPAIVRKHCAHEVALLQREAANARDPATAAALWTKCAGLEPDDPALLVSLYRVTKSPETFAKALAHPKLSKPLKAQLLIAAGDIAWKAGDAEKAQRFFAEAAQLPQSEPLERALVIRLKSVKDPATWPAVRPLLADGNPSPEILLELRDLDLARPRDGVAAYLIAKQLQNRGAWADCLKYATDALGRDLPGPLFIEEALRMRGISAWHLGDAAIARDAFTKLAATRPLEAQRWLERVQ